MTSSRVDLLTVGEAFEDLIFLGLPGPPRPGEELKTSRFVQTVGGGAVITAVATARLGLRTAIISGLSRSATLLLRREGVKLTNLRRPDEPHAITAALSSHANRSFVTFNGINDVLEPRLLEAMPGVAARHVHFALFPHDCRGWEPVIARFREAGVTTSWDFGWNEDLLRDRRFPFLATSLDYLFMNDQEAVLYARRLNLDAAVEYWRAHPHHVVIKLGARGSRWISGGRQLRAGARRVSVVDPTGAGDAFNAGYLYGVLDGRAPGACLKLGNFLGAMATREPGGVASLPTRAELP